MRKVSPHAFSLACRLLQMHAAKEGLSSECRVDALQQCCEALRPRISELVGREGFRALLARALALAKRERPWLSAVQVDTMGTLSGMDKALAGREPSEGEAGGTAVLAHLLELLAAFIGAELTGQLVISVWPDTHVGDVDFGIKEDEV